MKNKKKNDKAYEFNYILVWRSLWEHVSWMWKGEREMLEFCFESDNYYVRKLDNLAYIYVKLITTSVNKNRNKM